MRNFLSTAFKVFSRSLVVAAVFFSVGISVSLGQEAQITSFNSTKSEVLPTESFLLRWSSEQTTSCSIEVKLNSDIIGTRDGLPTNKSDGEDFNNREVGEYTYTLFCLSSLRSGPRVIDKSLQVKVRSATQINTRDQCLNDGNSAEVCTLCEKYPGSGLCQLCLADDSSQTCQSFVGQCQSGNDSDAEQCHFTQEQLARLAYEAGDTDAVPPKPEPSSFNSCIALPTYGFDMKKCGIAIFDSIILSLFAAFIRLCSLIFEITVYVGVVKFSEIVGQGPDSWITNIWGTIRDILNIGVIFVLLYAAINIIVGRGGEIKKLIARVILFGVLTNFSLFFTKAAIDLSNVVALEFYNQMRTEKSINTVSFDRGLGAKVVEVTGLIKLYTPPEASTGSGGGISEETKNKNSVLRDSFLFRLAMILVFIAIGFMFLQAAFIFLGRTVSLIFLLVFSPLMFAGGVFAPLQKWIKKWHEEFIGQTILAPVFFILLYVALTILSSLTKALDEQLQVIEGQDGDFILSLALILITAVLVIFAFSLALNKAKEMAGSIGGKAANLGNKLGGFALGKAVGGAAGLTARLGQQTLGRLGNKIDQGTGLMARTGQLLRLNKMKDASFDVRNTASAAKVGQGITKILSTATGAPVTINTGQGLKGRETRMKEGVELAQKKADTEIDTELKKIDEGTKQYDIFDQKIVDDTGNELVRTNENNDEWEKKVNVANKYQKGQALAKKNTYLASRPVASRSTSQLKTTAQKAQFKAVKAQQKKLSSETKKEQDHQIRKDKLKAYKDDLKTQFASDASAPLQPPLNNVKVLKSKSEIDAMGDEEVIALWDEIATTISTEMKLYKADKKSIIDNPNQHSIADQREVFRAISDFEKLQKRAGGAGKDIESLKKAIESHEQKK